MFNNNDKYLIENENIYTPPASIITAIYDAELKQLEAFPGRRLIGRLPSGYLVFEHDGDMFSLQNGLVMEMRGRWVNKGERFLDESIKATRLDIAFQAIRHQEIPGGSLVTFCQVMRPPSHLIGAEPQIVPVSVVFLPGVYLADAVGPDGQKGIYAIKDGLSLADVGLTTPEPTMGGMVMQ